MRRKRIIAFIIGAFGLLYGAAPTVANEDDRDGAAPVRLIGSWSCVPLSDDDPLGRPFLITFDVSRTLTTASVIPSVGPLRGQGIWERESVRVFRAREVLVLGGTTTSLDFSFTAESADLLSFSMPLPVSEQPIPPEAFMTGSCDRIQRTSS